MTLYRKTTFHDLQTFNYVNLDQLTETYSISFYGEYLTHWPEYQETAVHPTGLTVGYVLGKAEGEGEDWHGHVSAVTVAPTFRRLGLGERLMNELEAVTHEVHDAYFVDLFVRGSNEVAQKMYEKMGYIVYRRVLSYYSAHKKHPAEDALDMRRAMDKKRSKSAVVPLKQPVRPDQLEWQ